MISAADKILLSLLVFAINYVGIWVFLKLIKQEAFLDTPNKRSSHQTPTPRGGGLFIPVTFIFLLLSYSTNYVLSAIAILLVGAISFLDDLKGISHKIRLPVHFIAVMLLLFDTHAQWPVMGIVLGLILITGWLNTFNFMDGINGITTIYGIVFLLFLWGTPYVYSGAKIPGISVEPFVIVVLLAFGVFNFRKKARCFGGDVGSISLALIIAWSFLVHWEGPGSLYLLAFPLIYAVDSVMTIIIRIRRKENIFKAHRTHLYQLLANEKGLDHRVVALIYGILQIVINLLAILWLKNQTVTVQFMGLVLLYLLFCASYFLTRKQLIKGIEN